MNKENFNYIISNFITDIIDKDLENGKVNSVTTRFPPEPNGYLHIGHAKGICINYEIANYYNGKYHLRFDDTDPDGEDSEYIDSIINDIKWLGFNWKDNLFFASSYFDKMYEYAICLIKKEKAYVCHLSPEKTKEYRGSLTTSGKNSPYRNRSIEENLFLFEKMKKGEFKNGECVLRAKIDMSSPNMNLRDPIMYRIQHSSHHQTGNKWCIYPSYDWAHGLEDSIEGITHSLCSLEFEDHRPLYNWFLNHLDNVHKPQQIEFSRLNLNYTIMSKRYLKQLIDEKFVDSWDDPRMPTLSGMRRRGYTPESIKKFIESTGVSKNNSVSDYSYLEYFVRNDLDKTSPRAMAILNPLKVIVTNYEECKEEWLEAKNHPKDMTMGTRQIPFTRELYIEKEDFMENPSKKFFRLFPGNEVRFQHAYYLKCTNVIRDANKDIKEIHCTYDPKTKGGWFPERKVKSTLHWISAKYAKKAEIRNYDHLFSVENPMNTEEGKTFLDNINPHSLIINKNALVEPSLIKAKTGDKFQFLRHGYFCVDKSSTDENLVFNKTVSLKSTWKKIN